MQNVPIQTSEVKLYTKQEVDAIVAETIEACAKVCEDHASMAEAKGYTTKGETFIDGWGDGSCACAVAIRARGDNETTST